MSLSHFLLENRSRYLESIGAELAKDWTVVMGNEAGDLDSIASSLAYSWVATTVKKSPTIALVQTLRGDLTLRPENVHAFSLAGFDENLQELLCIDDLPLGSVSSTSESTSTSTPTSFKLPSNKFALVDHNRLSTRFQNDEAKVVAVIDHHEDEGLYNDTADPRIVVGPSGPNAVGSATSLVTQYIRSLSSLTEPEDWCIPPELATILLCGILVDTGGLKVGGKAERIDREAAVYLFPRSTLAAALTSLSITSTTTTENIQELQIIQTLTQDLFDKKSNVAHLSSLDLLRRDYKQYEWTCHWSMGITTARREIQVGLSTIPLGLEQWLSRDPQEFWNAVDRWMNERQLDVLGILTSFSKEKKAQKHKQKHHEDADADAEIKGKHKHKRQLLFVVREVPEILEGGDSSGFKSGITLGLADRLWEGLEGYKELELEERPIAKYTGHKSKDGGVGSRVARAYKQGNTKATRKVIAPLVKRIIEGDQSDQGLRAKARGGIKSNQIICFRWRWRFCSG